VGTDFCREANLHNHNQPNSNNIISFLKMNKLYLLQRLLAVEFRMVCLLIRSPKSSNDFISAYLATQLCCDHADLVSAILLPWIVV
jgi:hypothetical protein